MAIVDRQRLQEVGENLSLDEGGRAWAEANEVDWKDLCVELLRVANLALQNEHGLLAQTGRAFILGYEVRRAQEESDELPSNEESAREEEHEQRGER